MYAQLVNTLEQHLLAMEAALLSDDWESIRSLDASFQTTLKALVGKLPHDLPEQDKSRLGGVVARVMTCYHQIIKRCEAHRAGLQQEILSLNNAQKGIRSYQMV